MIMNASQELPGYTLPEGEAFALLALYKAGVGESYELIVPLASLPGILGRPQQLAKVKYLLLP